MAQQFSDSFVGGAFRTARRIATVILVGTSLVSCGAGIYIGKSLSDLSQPVSSGTGGAGAGSPRAPSQTSVSSSKKPAFATHQVYGKANSLSVDQQFFVELVDASFYARHPQLGERSLTASKTEMEAYLREDWWRTVDEVSRSLGQLDPNLRRSLGTYSQGDFYTLVQQAIDVGLSEEYFKRLVSERLNYLLPTSTAAPFIDPSSGIATPKFQVWCAIALEELQKPLKN